MTKEQQHTPRPWQQGPYNTTGIMLPEKCRRIFMPGNAAAWITGENQEANARLIAAAPELLVELEKLVKVAGRLGASCAGAKNIIAKAKGGAA